MNPVTTICPQCAEQQLSASEVRLVHCAVDHWSFYEFVCPKCLEVVRLPAPTSIRTLFKQLGVRIEFWDVPAEADEEHRGQRLTAEDLRTFIRNLDGIEDAVEELRRRPGTV